jgi:hypothetical protein
MKTRDSGFEVAILICAVPFDSRPQFIEWLRREATGWRHTIT